MIETAGEADFLRGELRRLRQNWAASLAHAYNEDPVTVARLCDEQYDRSGALLGYVRIAAGDARGSARAATTTSRTET